MLCRKMIATALCALMLLSCVLVTTGVDSKPISDWSVPVLLEGGEGYDAKECKVAMNSAGDAVAAWRSYNGDYWVINATTYTGGSWGVVNTLSAGPGDCWNPAVAIDDAGNAVVIYAQFDGSRYDAKAVSLIGGAWGSPYELDSDLMSIPTPQVAMNGTGYAIAALDANNDGASYINASVYQDGSWGPSHIVSDGIHSAGYAQVAVNNTGGAVVAWAEERDGINVISASSLDDEAWDSPHVLSIGSGSCAYPDVALSSTGMAVVVWQQENGGKYAINGTLCVGGTWLIADTLSETAVSSNSPQVAMDDIGDIGVVWTVDDGSTQLVTAARTFSDGVWNDVQTLSVHGFTAEMPQVAVSPYGETTVLWYEVSGMYSYIFARSFTNGVWSSEQLVSDAAYIFAPQLDMNDAGGAIAVWYETNGESIPYSVYASTYSPNTMPAVFIASPAEDDIITSSSVKVEWTGANVDHYTVSVDGATAVDVSRASNVTVDELVDGVHNVNVTAYDVRGRSLSAEVNFVVDTAAPDVSITNPAAGAWYNSSALNVTWSASDEGSGLLNVTVAVDDGDWFEVAANYHVIDGLADGHHVVYVRAYDNAGHNRTAYMEFNIQTALPVLNITAPSNDSLVNSRAVTVSWTGVSNSTVGQYWLSVDGGAFIDMSDETSHVISDLADGEHDVTLKAEDFAGNWNTSFIKFVVDATVPVVTITTPADGVHTTARDVVVEWTAYEAGSGLEKVEYSVDGGEWTVTADLSLELTNLEDGTHTVAVRAIDMAGNVGEASVELVIDNSVPTSTVSPSGNNAAIDSVVIVTFSEAMNESSVSIVVSGITGTVAWNGNVATFTPSGELAYDTAYTVTVSGKDLAGNTMSSSSAFTTLKNVGSLSGVIKDVNGSPMAGATVTLSNGMTTTTNAEGYFEFIEAPSGTYTMTVTKEGYQTITQSVSVVAGQSSSLASMSMTSSASSSTGDLGWILGIVGVVAVAMLGIGFIVYRYKKK